MSVLDLPRSSFLYHLATESSEFFGKLAPLSPFVHSPPLTNQQPLSILFSACSTSRGLAPGGLPGLLLPLPALWPRGRPRAPGPYLFLCTAGLKLPHLMVMWKGDRVCNTHACILRCFELSKALRGGSAGWDTSRPRRPLLAKLLLVGLGTGLSFWILRLDVHGENVVIGLSAQSCSLRLAEQ